MSRIFFEAVVLRAACALFVVCGSGCQFIKNLETSTESEKSGSSSVSDVDTDTVWKKSALSLGCDYRIDRVVNVRAHLTIEAGTRLCFDADGGISVEETGSLTAEGTSDKHITFEGTNPTKGYWRGIVFLSQNDDNQLVYADIRGAGSSSTFCCGYFYAGDDVHANVILGDFDSGASVTIEHSSIENGAGYGLFAFPGSALPNFAANAFSGNGLAPIAVTLTVAGSLDVASDYLGKEPNGDAWVRVIGNLLTEDITLHDLAIPYGVSFDSPDTITLRGRVDVEAGTQLLFETGSGWLIDSTGQLHVAGTPAQRVSLRGRQAFKGFWKGLAFLSMGNELKETDVAYGGSSQQFCCGFGNAQANLVVGDFQTTAGLSLTNVSSTQSGGKGIWMASPNQVTLNGTNDLTTGNTDPN